MKWESTANVADSRDLNDQKEKVKLTLNIHVLNIHMHALSQFFNFLSSSVIAHRMMPSTQNVYFEHLEEILCHQNIFKCMCE